jgi:hypothetical protein
LDIYIFTGPTPIQALEQYQQVCTKIFKVVWILKIAANKY